MLVQGTTTKAFGKWWGMKWVERTCGAGVPLVKTTLSVVVAVVGYFTCLLLHVCCYMLVTDGEPVCVCFLLVKKQAMEQTQYKRPKAGRLLR